MSSITIQEPKRWATFLKTPWKTVIGAGLATAVIAGIGVSQRPQSNPTPPSAGEVTCLVSNRTEWEIGGRDCAYGATITRTNQTFACSSSVTNVAASVGGVPPVRVILNYSQPVSTGGGGMMEWLNGCTGDGNNDTVDFIIQMNGLNGLTGGVGGNADSTKLKSFASGPTNLQATGNFECGRPSGNAHPDGLQIQVSATVPRNITIVNGRSGDYEAGTVTCQGAGGITFWSQGSGVTIIGGEYIGCNHGLNANQAELGQQNRAIDVKYRSGRAEGWDGSAVGQPTNLLGGDPNCIRIPEDCRYWPTGTPTNFHPSIATCVNEGGGLPGTPAGTCGAGHYGCPYNTSPPCAGRDNLDDITGLYCEMWNPTTNTWEEDEE